MFTFFAGTGLIAIEDLDNLDLLCWGGWSSISELGMVLRDTLSSLSNRSASWEN